MLTAYWRSMTAVLVAAGVSSTAIAPLMAQPAAAQSLRSPVRVSQLFDSARVMLPTGTPIETVYEGVDDEGNSVERIVVLPDETAPLSLTVTQDIRSRAGTVIIPVGSTLEGELRPLEGDTPGTQFVSERVALPNGQSYDIDAVSGPVTRTEVITEGKDPDFIKGAVIGAAAAAVLAEIIGDIDILEVLGGAGLGALGILVFGGGDEEVEVVVVEPSRDLAVSLRSDFAF